MLQLAWASESKSDSSVAGKLQFTEATAAKCNVITLRTASCDGGELGEGVIRKC